MIFRDDIDDLDKLDGGRSGATLAAVLSTPLVAEVDSHCGVATPICIIIPIDASTQVDFPSPGEEAIDPDMEISQENPQKIKNIPKNSERNSENPEEIPQNSQPTSYGDISDPILHALALALPWDRESWQN